MRIPVMIILILCIAGCKDKDGIPSGILKKDKMQAVLWDVVQAESFTTQFIKKDKSKNAAVEDAKLQQQIFAIHKISRADFYNSYQYYSSHVELMRNLLDSITSKGEREKYSTLYGKPPVALPVRVSLMPLPAPPPPKFIPMPIPTIVQPQTTAPVYTPPQQPVMKSFFTKPARNGTQNVLPK